MDFIGADDFNLTQVIASAEVRKGEIGGDGRKNIIGDHTSLPARDDHIVVRAARSKTELPPEQREENPD